MIHLLDQSGPTEFVPPYCHVLSYAVWMGDEKRSRQLWADYAASAVANLWLQPANGKIAGVIGFVTEPDAVVIRHLAVIPECRKRGIGRALVTRLAAATGQALVAETDADGIGFYERCKFEVFALPPQTSTVPRFRCVLSRVAPNQS